jgi:nitroimidazol reductase NimA-like FMN-containing flavoprotein (pyridoxamine 5'-phosphate oxidase superfamily)
LTSVVVESDRDDEERRRILRSVIAANRFMTLATADDSGTPWATPVWFASPDGRRFLWVSLPTTRHSRNIAARPDVAIVIYDSQTTPADRQAVYVEATASQVADDRIDEGMKIFAGELVSQGLDEWSRDDVTPPRRLRLYQAIARAHFILADATDERLSVTMA